MPAHQTDDDDVAALPDFAGPHASLTELLPDASEAFEEQFRPLQRACPEHNNWTYVASSDKWPYRAICKLAIIVNTSAGAVKRYGTGFLIAPRLVLTAGHNIETSWGRPQSIDVYAGRSPSAYLACARSTKFRAHDKYDGGAQYDLGAIILPDAKIMDAVQKTIDIKQASDSEAQGLLRIAGYPIKGTPTAQKPINTAWSNKGEGFGWKNGTVEYAIDAEEGMSGGPVFVSGYKAVGVHVEGDCPRNRGKLLASDDLTLLQRWIADSERSPASTEEISIGLEAAR